MQIYEDISLTVNDTSEYIRKEGAEHKKMKKIKCKRGAAKQRTNPSEKRQRQPQAETVEQPEAEEECEGDWVEHCEQIVARV